MNTTSESHIAEMLSQLERGRFFGSVELKYEAGHVVLVRKTETLKPTATNYGDNRGGNHEYATK